MKPPAHRPIEFVGSPRPTVGVEIELQIIDPTTRRLTNAAPRILKRFPGTNHVKPEVCQLPTPRRSCESLAYFSFFRPLLKPPIQSIGQIRAG